MTNSSEVNYIDFNGDGSTVTFAFPFKIFDKDDITVYLRQDDGLAATLQVEGTDYTVSGVGNDNGGSITFITAPTSDFDIVIYRRPPLTQETDFPSNGKFSSVSTEDALDKLNQQILWLNQQVGNSIRMQSWADDGINLTLTSPEAFANKLMQFDATGKNILPVSALDRSADTVTAGSSTTARSLSERFAETYNVKDWGAIGDGLTDDSAAIQAAISNAPTGSIVYFPPGTYLIETLNTILAKSNVTIMGYGATLQVPSDVTLPDPTGTGFATYDNGVIYNDGNTSIENFEVLGLEFDINNAKVDSIHMGDIWSELTTAEHTNITIKDIFHNGGNIGIYLPRGTECRFIHNYIEFTDSASIYAVVGTRNAIIENTMRYCGVSADYLTWNNAGAIAGNNNHGTIVFGNRVYVTGGTAISFVGGATGASNNMIIGNHIDGAGNSAISINGKGVGLSENNVVANNVITGWICAPNATSHSAISFGSSSTQRGISHIITGNVLDFAASWESFDATNNDIQGTHASPTASPYNTNKEAGGNVGGSAAIAAAVINATAGSILNGVVSNNIIRHAPVDSISLIYGENSVIEGNTVYRGGWSRDGSNNPYTTNHAINSSEGVNVKVFNNTISDHGRGVNADSRITPINFNKNIFGWLEGNSCNNQSGNLQYLALLQGASGNVTQLGYNEVASMTLGHNFAEGCSTTAAGLEYKYVIQNNYKINNIGENDTRTLTSATTISQQFTDVVLNSATARVQTLPTAAEAIGTRLKFHNINAGVQTITPAGTDTINGGGAGVGVPIGQGSTVELVTVDGTNWILTGNIYTKFTWDPANLADGAGETKSVTVTGAAFGDAAVPAPPYDLQDMLCTAYVQAANTIEVRLQNETGGAIDLASSTDWRVLIIKQ